MLGVTPYAWGLVRAKRTTKTRPHLPTLFFFVNSSENDMGGGRDVLLSYVTDDKEERQRETLPSRRLQISYFCKIDLRILFVFITFDWLIFYKKFFENFMKMAGS